VLFFPVQRHFFLHTDIFPEQLTTDNILEH
jgi:hypothetical protein